MLPFGVVPLMLLVTGAMFWWALGRRACGGAPPGYPPPLHILLGVESAARGERRCWSAWAALPLPRQTLFFGSYQPNACRGFAPHLFWAQKERLDSRSVSFPQRGSRRSSGEVEIWTSWEERVTILVSWMPKRRQKLMKLSRHPVWYRCNHCHRIAQCLRVSKPWYLKYTWQSI